MIFNLTQTSSRDYWSQERVVFKGTGISDPIKIWSNLHGSQAEPIATYSADGNGEAIIDTTDYLRTYNTQIGAQIILYFAIGANTYAKTMTNKGLINPENVVSPESEIGSIFQEKVFAPSRMLKPIAAGAPIVFEISNEYTYAFVTGRIKELPSGTITNFARSNTLAITTDTVEFWHLADRNNGQIELQELDECMLYAAVEWISFTGVKRRHTMQVRKRKTSNDGAYNLLGVDNEYVRIKGRVDGFDLYLDELDEYDVWYYADIINSSDVRISFDGENWARVEVTEKNYTLPDGDAEKNGKVEISVNYKKYDAFAM